MVAIWQEGQMTSPALTAGATDTPTVPPLPARGASEGPDSPGAAYACGEGGET